MKTKLNDIIAKMRRTSVCGVISTLFSNGGTWNGLIQEDSDYNQPSFKSFVGLNLEFDGV